MNTTSKKKTQRPKPPTIAEKLAHLKPLPWNALASEVIEAHNALLAALKGEG